MRITLSVMINIVMNQHPRLTIFGYDGDPKDKDYDKKRDELRNALESLAIALKFLKQCSKTKNFSKTMSPNSYLLKHHMEGSHHGYKPYKGYVSNGTAILACLLVGCNIQTIHTNEPNVLIAVKEPKPSN
jgi:hypothetical protein